MGAEGIDRPSNFGNGAAIMVSAHSSQTPREAHTFEGKLWSWVSASLIMTYETQDLAETGHGQKTAVLCVCNLPYLTQYSWRKLSPLEKLDGNLARYYTKLLCVCLLKEILEHTLLLAAEVEDRLVCA